MTRNEGIDLLRILAMIIDYCRISILRLIKGR